MRIFLIVFSLLAVTIFVFHFQTVIYEATTAPWTKFLAFICAELVQYFDDSVWADGVQILTDPSKNKENFSGIRIVAGCNGIEAWLVLVAAIMAFPPYSLLKFRWVALGMAVIILFPIYWDAWLWKLLIALVFLFAIQIYSPIGRQKLLGVALGFIAVQAMNVVRVISLLYLGQWDKEWFDFAHYYLWQALIILDAFVVFLFWLSKLPDVNDNDGNDKAEPLIAVRGQTSMTLQEKPQSQKPTIYRFFLSVLLWLIVCFIVWFLSAKILNIPLIWLSEWFLGWLTNGIVDNVTMRSGEAYKVINQQFIIHTRIPPPGQHPVFTEAKPLIYGYGLAIFAAMTLATPKDEGQKWLEISVGYVVFLFVQLFGIMNKMYIDLVFYAPKSISQYFPWVETHIDWLGASYQISTLVLPPVMPLILWILFNVDYIESLTGRKLPTSGRKK